MKTISKANLVITSVLALSMVMPSVAVAKGGDNSVRQAVADRSTVGFCANVGTLGSKVADEITRAETKRDSIRTTNDAKLAESRADRDARLSANRAKWDANRQEHFDKLAAKAKTDAQKQAVVTFQQTVTSAVTTRRDAVNAAIAAFRTGVDAAIAAHRGDRNGDAVAFVAAVNTAVAKAQASCAAGTDGQTVRQIFRSDIKAARDAFHNSKHSDATLGSQIHTLAQTKNAAIKQAVETFTATVKAAADQLKAALK